MQEWFSNPLSVALFVLLVGLCIVGTLSDACEDVDLFSGRIFDRNHRYAHVDFEFNGFFYALGAAVIAGAVACVFFVFANREPARVFMPAEYLSKDSPVQARNEKSGHAKVVKSQGAKHAGAKHASAIKHPVAMAKPATATVKTSHVAHGTAAKVAH
ncbi:MAG TPA: hypothetical protein PLI59_23655 [Candidatus Obscuribacter sp.]|nr:hypothetical protein [Candidatus Obscuribacter sp.]HNG22208.1 hypothetical protein [Candidatus Obscuribacter sp.]